MELNAKPSLAVIVPLLNEVAVLADLHKALSRLKVEQLIFVDGGSTDGTQRLLDRYSLNWVSSDPGRAQQMNTGARLASSEYLLFLHADTTLPPEFIHLVSGEWGRFDVQFDTSYWPMRVIAFFINLRSRLSGIATGDQAIFVRREIFEDIGGFPNQPLMEDVELSKRLKRISSPNCVRAKVTTSARRWQKNGLMRTVWLMWRLRWAYYFGASAEQLHQQYYQTR